MHMLQVKWLLYELTGRLPGWEVATTEAAMRMSVTVSSEMSQLRNSLQ